MNANSLRKSVVLDVLLNPLLLLDISKYLRVSRRDCRWPAGSGVLDLVNSEIRDVRSRLPGIYRIVVEDAADGILDILQKLRLKTPYPEKSVTLAWVLRSQLFDGPSLIRASTSLRNLELVLLGRNSDCLNRDLLLIRNLRSLRIGTLSATDIPLLAELENLEELRISFVAVDVLSKKRFPQKLKLLDVTSVVPQSLSDFAYTCELSLHSFSLFAPTTSNEFAAVRQLSRTLTQLSLHCKSLQDISVLKYLEKLRFLEITRAPLNGVGLAPVSDLRNTLTDFHFVPVADATVDISEIKGMGRLKTCKIWFPPHLDVSLAGVPLAVNEMTSLRELYISKLPYTGSLVLCQSILCRLERLSYAGYGIEDISFLADAVRLEYLCIYDGALTDLMQIASLPSLEELDITNTSVRRVGVMRAAPRLRTISISKSNVKDQNELQGTAINLVLFD